MREFTDRLEHARQVKAHVVFAPSVIASPYVSAVKLLCDSSVASQVSVVDGRFARSVRRQGIFFLLLA